jgi:hypothetical protein
MLKLLSKFCFIPNFYLRYKSFFLGNDSCINQIKRDIPIIISITSQEENFYDLELTLYSLLNQSVLPDKIILWLSDKYDFSELPYGITRFIKNGLEIRLIKDLKDFNKIIYPLKEFSDSIIVTASDCIYYKRNWLKKLYHSYVSNPDDIHVHLASRVQRLNNSVEISIPNNLLLSENGETASYCNLASGIGGILYPPFCFKKEVFRKDIYAKPGNTSDVWMWIMSLLSERKTRIVKFHIKTFSCVNLIKFLKYDYPNSTKYEEQLKYLMTYYAQNIEQKLK